MLKTNEGKLDRGVRILTGSVALIAGLFVLDGVLKIIAIIAGSVALITGIVGFCGLYSLLGISTNLDKK